MSPRVPEIKLIVAVLVAGPTIRKTRAAPGFIPFKINELTLAVNPVKMLEYFALGLPVISTPLPEVVKYSDSAYIASGSSEFAAAIERALHENNAELAERRRKIAAARSWKGQSDQLRRIIEEALNLKTDATR